MQRNRNNQTKIVPNAQGDNEKRNEKRQPGFDNGRNEDLLTVGSLQTSRKIELLLYIFETLDAYYGAKWNSTEQAVCDNNGTLTLFAKAWIDCLGDKTKYDVQYAMTRLKREAPKWPPGALEFAELCRPNVEDLHLPDANEAYRQACNSDWTHGIVWHAAQKIGTWELRNKPETKTRRQFEDAYRDLIRRAQTGERFDRQSNSGPVLTHEPPVPDGYAEDHSAIASGASPIDLARERLRRGAKAKAAKADAQAEVHCADLQKRRAKQDALLAKTPRIQLPVEKT